MEGNICSSRTQSTEISSHSSQRNSSGKSWHFCKSQIEQRTYNQNKSRNMGVVYQSSVRGQNPWNEYVLKRECIS